MKRFKILINVLIILTILFLIYKVYSYIDTKKQEDEAKTIYKEIEEISFAKDDDNDDAESAVDEEKIDFAALKAINEDIMYWIKSDEGSIDYPVVKARDNDYYLHHAANKKRNLVGSIFMDYRNESIDDSFVIIYGHMMNNGSMFATLNEFKKKDPSYRGFTISAEMGDIRTTSVLAARVSGETYINPKEYTSFEKRKSFFNELKKHAYFDAGYELKEDDRLILLVTCTYEKRNQRLIVVTVEER